MTGPLPLEFLGSFPDPLHPLDPSLPEIALLGRSNVGKSSLLNALAGRRRLAKVSATPGKTTLLNVYRMPGAYLLDLPGYGYARHSKQDRSAFRRLLHGVIRQRTTVGGVIWLLDIRHPPSREDREMQDLLAQSARPVLVVLTKADKLRRQERARAVGERAREIGIPEAELLPSSSTTRLGIDELARSIRRVAAAS